MGNIAWAIKHLYGDEILKKFIADSKVRPPFVVSNGFPSPYFPKLIMPPPSKLNSAATKRERLAEAKENKKNKSRTWLTKEEFSSMARGEIIRWQQVENPERQQTTIHAIINRSTGRSLEDNGLYELEEIVVNQITFFIRFLDLAYRPLVEKALAYIGKIGFGAKKSSGKGVFEVESIEELSSLVDVPDANGYAVLSNFVPSERDSTTGYYKLFTKYGKLGEELANKQNPFKYPIVFIQAGSCFYSKSIPDYCGTILEKVSPQFPEVVQFAFGLTIPVRLPNID
jgi:CRISPR-associated protein Csm4